MKGVRVPRTCTPVSGQRGSDRREAGASARAEASRPLSAHRDDSAYVLLGDPGAGKSTAFRCEYEALGGERAHLIAARDFPTLAPAARREWRDKTLFIDGLDEVRAGAPDARAPFDAICAGLVGLGMPRFRLSCRAADWLGSSDRRHLEAVSPGNRVTVLALDPLTSDDALRILDVGNGPSDAAAFIESARDRGLDALLANPQSLVMLADAVNAGGEWPTSRTETFERACRSMAEEMNEEHANALEDWYAPPDVLVDAAGRLCAGLLLADRDGYSLRPSASDVRYPLFHGCVAEPEGSPESAAGAAGTAPDGARRLLRRALRTRLFTSPAADGRYSPAHRHVAEFLAARHAARLIEAGLPARRVLALIVGGDGTVVTALRGFSGWLAALCRCSGVRRELIDRDPVGVALYGDAAGFSTDDKRRLLRAVHRGRIAARRISVVIGFQVVRDSRSRARATGDPDRSRPRARTTELRLLRPARVRRSASGRVGATARHRPGQRSLPGRSCGRVAGVHPHGSGGAGHVGGARRPARRTPPGNHPGSRRRTSADAPVASLSRRRNGRGRGRALARAAEPTNQRARARAAASEHARPSHRSRR